MIRSFIRKTPIAKFRFYTQGIKPRISLNDAADSIELWSKGKGLKFPLNLENINLIYLPMYRYTFTKNLELSVKVSKRTKTIHEKVSVDVFFYADTKYEKYFQGILQEYDIKLVENLGQTTNLLKVTKDPNEFKTELENKAYEVMSQKIEEVFIQKFGQYNGYNLDKIQVDNVSPKIEYFPIYKYVFRYLNNHFIVFVNGIDRSVYGDVPKYQTPLATYSLVALLTTYYLEFGSIDAAGGVLSLICSYGIHRGLQAYYVLKNRKTDEMIETNQFSHSNPERYEQRKDKFNIKEDRGNPSSITQEIKYEPHEDPYQNIFKDMKLNDEGFELKTESNFELPEFKFETNDNMTKDEKFQIGGQRFSFSESDDYYAVLGLKRELGDKYTQDTIQRAFEKVMKKLEKENRKEMIEKVKKSYSIIGNKISRIEYDNFLKKKKQ